MIKSPLRYPGENPAQLSRYNSNSLKSLIFLSIENPLWVGVRVFIYIKQIYPNIDIWINDLNPEVLLFWKMAQS